MNLNKRMLMGLLPLILMVLSSLAGAAGSGALTQKGIKSAGSGMAFLDLCEVAGHAPEGLTARYQAAAQAGLTKAHWDAVERQYKESLREQMMYLPSQDAWLKFEVEPIACEQITKVSETLIKNYEDLAKLAEER